ncbi:hypothetical protein GWI33_010487 [Rhynchophorus ferrugineus]|uniref:ATP synthase F(0) complex subunit e, mitochondrial n=1 Tax=Rhynchophorus ferrugineus TaxID=354439 RepID=A0A834IXB3_RHYFE|nr:hypothetical protein GWI33_010487 [Rhynchophorus ferrugineus]
MSDIPPPFRVSPVIKFFRYSFLCTGIVYGYLRHHALKALEDSKQEERAVRRAERLARLEEEKRLSAQRDFEQIVEIFTPPPPPPPKITVEGQGYFLGIKGVGPEQCESKYENIDQDDTSNPKLEIFGSKIEEFSVDEETIELCPPESTDFNDLNDQETIENNMISTDDIAADDNDPECTLDPKD